MRLDFETGHEHIRIPFSVSTLDFGLRRSGLIAALCRPRSLRRRRFDSDLRNWHWLQDCYRYAQYAEEVARSMFGQGAVGVHLTRNTNAYHMRRTTSWASLHF